MYDTETRAQFIDLRAKGWSYSKIARHTAISRRTLVNWGRLYTDDIAHLKSDYLRSTSPFSAGPEGPAHETYFHNLEGYPNDDFLLRPSALVTRRSTSTRNIGSIGSLFRLWKRVCRLFAALRYLMFKP
jgi:hypothetical protein